MKRSKGDFLKAKSIHEDQALLFELPEREIPLVEKRKHTPDSWWQSDSEQIRHEHLVCPSITPPISYIGSKYRLFNQLMDIIPSGTNELVSPFMGGASLELRIAGSGIQVYTYDIFHEYVEFYQTFNGQSDEIVKETLKIFPLNREDFQRYRGNHEEWAAIPTAVKRAAVTWCINKATFMSKGFASLNPIKTIHHASREMFKQRQWHNWYNPYIQFDVMSYEQSLAKHSETIAYLDPPYLAKEHFYGRGDQDEFDHDKLFEILDARQQFVMSYGTHPYILELYKDYKILEPQWKYGFGRASDDKTKSEELLIISHDLA